MPGEERPARAIEEERRDVDDDWRRTPPRRSVMRVFVTGGGGFLGSALVRRLAARGDTAIAFDRSFDLLARHAAPSPRIVAATGDVTDAAGLTEALRRHRPDAVIHCAAVVSVLSSIDSPVGTVRINVEGAVNLFEAMRACGVRRAIHISSEETYGEFRAPVVDEDHPLAPVMFYGVTKVAVEHLGRCYRDLYGMEVINLRTSWVYGPDLPRDRVPKNLIDAALAGRPLHVPSGADSAIDHTYVDDFVDGTLAALDCARHPFDVYNLASGTAPTLAEVVAAVKEIVPGAEVSVGPGVYRHGDRIAVPRKGALDFRRARAAFGYAPRFDIRAGLRAYVAAKSSQTGAVS
jgi:UDP-glucose 4-epimerase